MASAGHSSSVAASSPQDVPRPAQTQSDEPTSSTPLEMSSLPANNTIADTQSPSEGPSIDAPEVRRATSRAEEPSRTEAALQTDHAFPLTFPATSATPTRLTRLLSTAIGPSSDEPIPVANDVEETGPTLMITLLLINGARHPFKLDSKYLHKRNVEVQGNDPFNLSVYKLKELILREWREEWESKPSSPSSIRLISFGKLLDDKAPLKDSKFNHDAPNVVHMTVKPQDILDEEEAAAKGGKNGGRGREGDDRSPGCRCVVL